MEFKNCFFMQRSILIKIGLLFFIFLMIFFVGLKKHTSNSQLVDFYNDMQSDLFLVGSVCGEVDERLKVIKYTICVENFLWDFGDQRVSGKILITTGLYPVFEYGDLLRFRGKLKTPSNMEEFDYQNYLARYKIFSVMYYPQIEIVDVGKGNYFLQKLFRFKSLFELRISQIFPKTNSDFLAGLLIGSRRGIAEEIMNDFNLTGLTHIIAISGYNITIIIVFISSLLRFLPRRLATYTSILGVIVFTVFVGASAAVVRAAIMGVISLIVLQKGRDVDSLILILLTAAIMIGINPKIFWYDVGFQLSFLAVLGLFYVTPLFGNLFQKIPQTLALRESLELTLAAQITAVPLILLNFERLSLIAPLANILVAPFIPLAMLFGFLALVGSFVNFGLGLVFGFVAYIALEIILKIAEYLAKIPFASIEIVGVSYFVVIGYYVFLIMVIYNKNKRDIKLFK